MVPYVSTLGTTVPMQPTLAYHPSLAQPYAGLSTNYTATSEHTASPTPLTCLPSWATLRHTADSTTLLHYTGKGATISQSSIQYVVPSIQQRLYNSFCAKFLRWIFGDRIANATAPPSVNGFWIYLRRCDRANSPIFTIIGFADWLIRRVCCAAGKHWIHSVRLQAHSTTTFSRDRHRSLSQSTCPTSYPARPTTGS